MTRAWSFAGTPKWTRKSITWTTGPKKVNGGLH